MSDYEIKKKKFTGMMTLYGRKPVLEVLSDPDVNVFRLHLATTNADGSVIREIEKMAQARGVDTIRHDRQALSRISKNGRQDQGVALDIEPSGYRDIEEVSAETNELIG
ncbi:MAG: 23S rRNA (guanosine(2251)-2'-O)-methyltransferase RlmB, partial [Gammaproteobacteria bacterium]|nr:23S rRNA (guanosine(2251)-2'-O)-methyltransferase RlmB [Gammaproteobacteria bacterium]